MSELSVCKNCIYYNHLKIATVLGHIQRWVRQEFKARLYKLECLIVNLSVILKGYQILFFLLPETSHSPRQKPEKGGRAVGNKFPVPSRSSSDPLSSPVYSDSVLSAYLLTLLPTVPPSGYSINMLVK